MQDSKFTATVTILLTGAHLWVQLDHYSAEKEHWQQQVESAESKLVFQHTRQNGTLVLHNASSQQPVSVESAVFACDHCTGSVCRCSESACLCGQSVPLECAYNVEPSGVLEIPLIYQVGKGPSISFSGTVYVTYNDGKTLPVYGQELKSVLASARTVAIK